MSLICPNGGTFLKRRAFLLPKRKFGNFLSEDAALRFIMSQRPPTYPLSASHIIENLAKMDVKSVKLPASYKILCVCGQVRLPGAIKLKFLLDFMGESPNF